MESLRITVRNTARRETTVLSQEREYRGHRLRVVGAFAQTGGGGVLGLDARGHFEKVDERGSGIDVVWGHNDDFNRQAVFRRNVLRRYRDAVGTELFDEEVPVTMDSVRRCMTPP